MGFSIKHSHDFRVCSAGQDAKLHGSKDACRYVLPSRGCPAFLLAFALASGYCTPGMKLKFLPWVLMVAALVCLGVVYNSNQQQVAELAQARAELEQLRAAPSETNQSANVSEKDELTRLREE